MAKTISEILKPFMISLDIKATLQEEAVREVALMLKDQASVTDFEGFYNDLLTRERQESTCFGHEVAFPHARTDNVKDMVISVGRSRHGVPFVKAHECVKLIFVIGTPKRMVTEYLATVGALARLLKEDAVRQKLISAKSQDEFFFHLTESQGKL
ncbi:MAG: PTS sugar transporter subunit IIA [Methylacidiphilales bacterium]|nr:PTS sugar transporter subunit IIA [Candidatus Methylacidiphilales bacterium]